jgi:hypothetical protein
MVTMHCFAFGFSSLNNKKGSPLSDLDEISFGLR